MEIDCINNFHWKLQDSGSNCTFAQSSQSRVYLWEADCKVIWYRLPILLAAILAMSAYRPCYFALTVFLSGSFVASPLTLTWLSNNIPQPGKRALVLVLMDGISCWNDLKHAVCSKYVSTLNRPSTTLLVQLMRSYFCCLGLPKKSSWLLSYLLFCSDLHCILLLGRSTHPWSWSLIPIVHLQASAPFPLCILCLNGRYVPPSFWRFWDLRGTFSPFKSLTTYKYTCTERTVWDGWMYENTKFWFSMLGRENN
jgi:hypothetical protein